MKEILIVEDDITFALMLKTFLSKKGFGITCVSSVADAEKKLAGHDFQLILSDLRLPEKDGFSLLAYLRKTGNITPLIMMTSYADIQTAVQAIKSGASDYIAKPVNPEELLKKIRDLLTTIPAEKPVKNPVAADPNEFPYLLGKSDAARQLYEYVSLVAPTDMSVLINGSSGTGKEHIARLIHQQSNRKNHPFIAVDCGAVPRELAASEFFGHLKGSFTGAIDNKTGAFIAADKGTLFLDEIGNLSYEIQIQLLRALQERKIKPIGSNTETPTDVRIIAATNENLTDAIAEGTFREDLYHRLNEFGLTVPDLKDRAEDIPLFADYFLDLANKELGKRLTGFRTDALELICRYDWPGNLRQLKNTVKRATLLAREEYITGKELPPDLYRNTAAPTLALKNAQSEKQQILEALKKTGNNKSKAAALLQIDRKTLYNKLKLYHIDL